MTVHALMNCISFVYSNLAAFSFFSFNHFRQRLMQELQTTRGLLMRCWTRVRDLEQQQASGNMLEGS